MHKITIIEHPDDWRIEVRFLDHSKVSLKQITIDVTTDVFELIQNAPLDRVTVLVRSILNNQLHEKNN